MAGLAVAYPFDTVKVLLQTQDSKKPVYRGTVDCIRKIVVRDSLKGLYRGMSSPMAGVTVVNAIVFGVYGNTQRYMSDPNSLYSHFVAGSMAGICQSVICSPMELVKTRLQLQQTGAAQKYRTPTDCLQHIWKQEGFRGIFRGFGITMARDVPG
jgi:solute carrier family 25 carnitine/acylcarnitine transporter 20/29